MIALRLAAALVLVGTACAAAPQDVRPNPRSATPDANREAIERGRQLTTSACAGCHAIGATGASPMAAATPFRTIVHRYPLDQLEEGFAEGLVTAHPAMPEFVFRASEIDDLIAYLETVKAEP